MMQNKKLNMGEIIIKEKVFNFNEIELTYENAQVLDSTIAKNNLLDFKKVLDEQKITFLIMHGTLLGAVRDNCFIKHDIDIDTCTYNEKKLIESIPLLDKVGLKLCRYEPNIIYSFIRDNVYIDVYIVNKLQGLIRPFYVRYLTHIIPRKYFRHPKKMFFLDVEFNIPNHSLDLLEFWYGPDWKKPISNCPSNDQDPKGSYLEKNKRFLFRPFYKIIK